MKQLRRTKQVRDDLIAIYRHLHGHSPQAVERVLDSIERSIRSLQTAPGLGRRWDSPHLRLEGMRVLVVARYPNYLLFFRATDQAIEILRVIHGARELERIIDDIELDFDD
jgi:toxin ParE1/3/4